MQTNIIFHYDQDEFAMNQWYMLVQLFKATAMVINSGDKKIYRSCSKIDKLDGIKKPLVLMTRDGKTSIEDYKHENDDVFVFWADHENMPTQNVEWKDTVRIPTIGDGDMYSYQAGTILLYERMKYGKLNNR